MTPDGIEVWTPATMADARVGDMIRPRGTTAESDVKRVIDRYLPPRKDGGNAGHWHIASAPKHWDDRVVREGEVWLVLEGSGGNPVNLRPDFLIEILMPADWHQVMTQNGWTWADRLDAKVYQ